MSPCRRCDAKCCKYIAVEIDKPDTLSEFDEIRWMLAHRGVTVFIDEGEWFFLINGKCRYLDEKNRCTIYDNRPALCRKHKAGECEVDGSFDYEYMFKKPRDLALYMKEHKIRFPPNWPKHLR